jgi:hypothetical protein
VEWGLAGETAVLGENLLFVHHKIPHDQTRARTPGRRGGKPATNRLSYGAALWVGFTSSSLQNCVGFVVLTTSSERAKTVHALDRSATVADTSSKRGLQNIVTRTRKATIFPAKHIFILLLNLFKITYSICHQKHTNNRKLPGAAVFSDGCNYNRLPHLQNLNQVSCLSR